MPRFIDLPQAEDMKSHALALIRGWGQLPRAWAGRRSGQIAR